MTKSFNFALVGRVAHAKSSDPATPPKFGTCTCCKCGGCARRAAKLKVVVRAGILPEIFFELLETTICDVLSQNSEF